MKYIKTQRLFVKKKKKKKTKKRKKKEGWKEGRKEGRKDRAIHRTEIYLMHCIGQASQTPAIELKRRACTLNVYSGHIRTCEPT